MVPVCMEQMGLKLLEILDAGGITLDKTPCDPQLFLGETQSRVGHAGEVSPECRSPGSAGCSHEPHHCDLKGKSIASPWLLSLESHIKHLRRRLSPELFVTHLCRTCWSYKALKLSCLVSSTPADALGCFGHTQPQSRPLQVKNLKSESGLDSGKAGVLPYGQISSRLQESKPGADPSLVCASYHHHVCWGPGTLGPFAQRENPTAVGAGQRLKQTPQACGWGTGWGSVVWWQICAMLWRNCVFPGRLVMGVSAHPQS